MELESVFITGANRGIGLEFVRQLIKLSRPPRFVFATFRGENSIKELEEIKENSKVTAIVLIKMDVREAEDIDRAQKVVEEKVGDNGLTLLINNAGVLRYKSFSEIQEEDLLFHYRINTVGPVMVLKKMLPLLQKTSVRKIDERNVPKAVVLNISGLLGSTSKAVETPEKYLSVMSYRTSKAALNMAMRIVALTVKDQGVLIVNMCPGSVKTDMGTEDAHLELPDSVSAMMNTISRLDESHHGTFINRKGEIIPY